MEPPFENPDTILYIHIQYYEHTNLIKTIKLILFMHNAKVTFHITYRLHNGAGSFLQQWAQ